jgi:acyl carrier protein
MSDKTHIVRQLLAEVCAVDPASVQPDAALIDYGLDSARAIDLIVGLEEAFTIRIPDDAVAKMKTLRDIVTYVEART